MCLRHDHVEEGLSACEYECVGENGDGRGTFSILLILILHRVNVVVEFHGVAHVRVAVTQSDATRYNASELEVVRSISIVPLEVIPLDQSLRSSIPRFTHSRDSRCFQGFQRRFSAASLMSEGTVPWPERRRCEYGQLLYVYKTILCFAVPSAYYLRLRLVVNYAPFLSN